MRDKTMRKRKIPSSGEEISFVGLGTCQYFNVGSSNDERQHLRDVLTGMNEAGGTVIDSSPMYGRSEEVVGDLTDELDIADKFFYATEVWTSGEQDSDTCRMGKEEGKRLNAVNKFNMKILPCMFI